MSKDLVLFDKLKADITLFVSPVTSVTVTDFKSSDSAVETAKAVKEYRKKIEDLRKHLVGPLNDQVKAINAYAKSIDAPLVTAEDHVRAQINAFAAQQEEIRRADLKRVEEERQEIERQAIEAQRIKDEELAQKQAEERALHERAAAAFGSDDESPLDGLQEQQERERLEAQAAAEREAAMRANEARQREFDIKQQQIKGTTMRWKCEVTDINLVPLQFLIRELNSSMVLAAARGGVTEIPGVRLWQEASVSIGVNTYVPRSALK